MIFYFISSYAWTGFVINFCESIIPIRTWVIMSISFQFFDIFASGHLKGSMQGFQSKYL